MTKRWKDCPSPSTGGGGGDDPGSGGGGSGNANGHEGFAPIPCDDVRVAQSKHPAPASAAAMYIAAAMPLVMCE